MKKKTVAGILVALGLALGGFYLWHARVNQHKAHLAEVLDIARLLRPAPVGQKQVSDVDVVHDIERTLVDYTVDDDIKKTIAKFLNETVGMVVGEFAIEQLNGAAQHGLSGNPLFLVKNAQGDLLFVIKVFKGPFHADHNFMRELSGFQVAATIDGKSFTMVTARAVGKCVIGGERYGLLAISPAVGTSLADVMMKMIAYLRMSQHSPEMAAAIRQELVEAISLGGHAFKRLGQVYAELHQLRAQKEVGIHPSIVRYAETKLIKVLRVLERDDHGIDRKVLQRYFYALLDRLQQEETIRSFVHGDPNPANFMYDAKTDSLYMVDLGGLIRAADCDGNPIGNRTVDFVGAIDGIEIDKLFGLPEQERARLVQAFVAGYGTVPTKLERDFFTLLHRLRFLGWSVPFEMTQGDAETLGVPLAIWQHELEELKKLLSTLSETLEL